MKIAYFDCFSGISGDMCLGALVDAGMPLSALKKELGKLPLKGYRIKERKVIRGGIEATKVDVAVTNIAASRPRNLEDIEGIINKSGISRSVKKRGLGIFREIFRAEAAVHGKPSREIHLHELGATDAIVDIIGTLLCLEALGIEEAHSSAVNVGGGTVMTMHGVLPVPAPATAELLKGLPVYSSCNDRELATPTGAAIIKGICSGFGYMPPMVLLATGTGAGGENPDDRPNVLRIMLGEKALSGDAVTVLETNIDDMSPQIFEYVMERLLEEGALDVYLSNVIMKKSRPAVKMTVLCPEEKRRELEEIIFNETTTLGLRFWRAERSVLERSVRKLDTVFGPIRIKEATLNDKTLRITPEYDDCRKAAKKHKAPLSEVIRKTGSHNVSKKPGRSRRKG
jgi:uncharacterized protein (TIGR00299 family) protein